MSLLSPLDKNYRLKKEIQDLIDKTIEESKRKGTKKNDEVTTKQQILLLHYLGIIPLITLDDDTKKSLLLSKLLNRDSQNIREYLGHVNGVKIELSDIKTKRNLEIVRDIFKELKMSKEMLLVNRDLEALD